MRILLQRVSRARVSVAGEAEPLVRAYAEAPAATGVEVKTGTFGAHMDVELVNDGPVTIWLDSAS